MYWIITILSSGWLFWLTKRLSNKDIFIYYIVTTLCCGLSYILSSDWAFKVFKNTYKYISISEVDVYTILRLPLSGLACFCIAYSMNFLFLRNDKFVADFERRLFYGIFYFIIPFLWFTFCRYNLIRESLFIMLGFTMVCTYDTIAQKFGLIYTVTQDKKSPVLDDSEANSLMTELSQLIANKANNLWDHYFVRGNLYFEKGAYEDAIKDFDEVIALLSNKPEINEHQKYLEVSFDKRGKINALETKWGAALKDFEQAALNSTNKAKYNDEIKNARIRSRQDDRKIPTILILLISLLYLDSRSLKLPLKYLPEVLPGVWKYKRKVNEIEIEGVAVFIKNGKYVYDFSSVRLKKLESGLIY